MSDGSYFQIKSVLSEKLNQPIEKLCLIFSGKILKDHETIDQHCECFYLLLFSRCLLSALCSIAEFIFTLSWAIIPYRKKDFQNSISNNSFIAFTNR